MALITLDQAKAHLRMPVDADDEDEDLDLKIEQAEAIVFDYLKADVDDYSGDSLPKQIEAAILLVLTDLWDRRGGGDEGDYLKQDGPVARVLARTRDPALA